MKKFAFRLSKVLRVRQIRERLKEVELGLALTDLAREQHAERLLRDAIDESSQALTRRLSSRFSVAEALLAEAHIVWLKAKAAEQVGRVQKAEVRVHQSQQQLLYARQERKALEKLNDRHKSQYMQAIYVAEQKALDDIKRSERR